ncbi:MerR family transcriptional regulator [Streptomyces sp. NBC_01723]|uniref:MerR family transcriptional regulator n=1 Tax=Streptomyces sp. NBC_01723 TaxID=2975921 RepID=UPI002E35C1E3|nr:MerR family transcriptional regulator [Streptomyces sp. NBC_01723]
MRIGQLSEATGVSTRSLRYYEEQGLLHSYRQANGYRQYTSDAVEQVAFIQDLFSAGLSSQIIRESLELLVRTPSGPACAALLRRVREIRNELARQEQRLTARRKTLDSYLAGHSTPRGMTTPMEAARPE